MKIYIIERDNPKYKPNPEVFFDGNKAVNTVKEEYIKQMDEPETSREKQMLYSSCGYYWNFEEGECCGDALIDQDNGERWEWKITEHEVEIQ